MDLFDYFTRVNFSENDLGNIMNNICNMYSFGSIKSYRLIETGYEDFNVILDAEKGKYVVKFFANNRTLDNIKHYIKIVDIITSKSNDFRTPKIYQYNDNTLNCYKVNGKNNYFFVMEYIEGKTIYELEKNVDIKTLLKIVFDILKYNCTNQDLKDYLKTPEAKKFKLYDMWSYENFLKEYEDKSKYLSESDKLLMEGVVKYFSSMQERYKNYDKLFKHKPVMPPYMSAHNDFISTNIIIDSNHNPCYIDFSVSSVALNFVDIAIFGCDSVLCKNITSKRYVEYLKIISYTLYRCHVMEYNLYPSAVCVQHAIHILISNYYKVCEGVRSRENNYFLNIGRKGLKYIIHENLLNEPVFNWVSDNGWFRRAELSKKSEYVAIKGLIKKMGLDEFVEENIREYHRLYNESNDGKSFANITFDETYDDGYDWLYANIENLKYGDSLKAISFCNANEWNGTPEEEEWTKLNIDAIERGVNMKRIFVYPSKFKHLLLENSSIKKFVKLKKDNVELTFVSDDEIKKMLGVDYKLVYPGILLFNDSVAYKDVVDNDDVRGYVISSKEEIEKYNKIYDNIAKKIKSN